MEDKILRYIRQTALPEMGITGQKRLMDSKAALVGAGALGSPAAVYLASAGIGKIGIVDDDVVELDNLHRQILHRTGSLGRPKVESARDAILEIDPDIIVETYRERLTATNAEAIFKGYDLVVDGSDNFETRYAMNEACVRLGIPLVHGSVLRFTGQVSVFVCHPRMRGNDIPCYACLYPEPPPAEVSPTCARAGVLGAVPGVIGTLQALEALKLMAGFGEPLTGKLLIFDGLTGRLRTLEVKKDPKCRVCS
jgi:molybdopterin/thiamine biosynthesis adenylyltransferase